MSTAGDQPEAGEDSLRLDKWLWYARFFKSRSLSSALCASGKVRVGGEAVRKANRQVRPGDVLTFPQGRHIRVIKVLALAMRRGPASEARLLYEDLKPPDAANRLPGDTPPVGRRPRGSGRPTKRERRQLGKLQTED